MRTSMPRRFYPLVILFAILVLTMPRTAKFGYDYRKGSPWPYETLIAQFDFPILKTEEQILEERENAVNAIIPYFRKSQEITNSSIKALESLDLGKYNYLRPAIVGFAREIYQTGVLSDAKVKVERGEQTVSDQVLFIQSGKRAQKYPFSEVYKASSARDRLLASFSAAYPAVNADSLFSKGGVYDMIVPNLVYDKQMTGLSHVESAGYVSPTQGYVNADQKIVSKGEIVTSEIAQMLDSYKVEYNNIYGYDGPRILIWLGNILIALALVVILYFCIWYTNPKIFDDWNRYLYLLTVFLMAALATFVMDRIRPQAVYAIPFSLIALYLLAFFDRRVVLPVYIVSLLPLLIFQVNGVELYVMFLAGGVVSIYTFQYFRRGWLQFVNALIVFAVIGVVYTGFRLIDTGSSSVIRTVLDMLLGSMLMVALYPLIYLFEKIFNLVSSNRLSELADTNNSLLQELSGKAPGTFQHSIQVMNMAEAAARSVGANIELVRAGALYHDIGKMRNPLCFIENESSVPGAGHYHDGLSPKESAAQIVKHVPDGVEIASQKGLPDVIKDFIITHHGTSATGYFYNRYLNEGGDPEDVADFYYKGRKPVTKEQVILMLCDSVEAASRTLKEYSTEAFDSFVEGMVASKMKDGQLDESALSISELITVKSALKNYLRQIYHERVEYPKLKVSDK